MTDWIWLGVGVLLTIGTGLFVASEFSLLNLERVELESRRERGERGLSNTIRALARTSTHLSGAQLGITLTTMLTGFVAEPALSRLLSPLFIGWLEPGAVERGTVAVITMLIATIFSTLIGELVPKKLALSLPLAVNRFVVLFQLAFTWVFGFLIVALNRVGNGVVRLFGVEPKEELSSTRTADELSSLVMRSAHLGALEESTATLLTKTLHLSQLVAADIMTPRPSMATISVTASVADLIQLSAKTGYSRFPVVADSSDDIAGIAHVKLAVAIPREKRAGLQVTAIMAEPMRVPETMGLEALMIQLRSHGLQMAIVVDEYGGTAGLATLEDLVEELVGELADEHDRSRINVTRGAKNSLLFPGMKRPDELEVYAIKVPEDGSYETVGGFIMSALGRIPSVNDEVEIEDGKLVVVRMDGRRIDRVRFVPHEDQVATDE